MFNTSPSSLLDSLDGKSEEIAKTIQQLCGRSLIFRFNMNNHILIKGVPSYAVKKTFVPNDKLEMEYLKDNVYEDLMDDEVDNVLKQDTSKPKELVKRLQIQDQEE